MPALEAADIFCAPVLNYEDVTGSEQARVNGYFATLDHPRMGKTRVVPCPISFSETPAAVEGPEPALGQHTEEVLGQFGYAAGEIEAMRTEGIV